MEQEEDIEFKINDFEDEIGAIKEFVIEKLHGFNTRLTAMEQHRVVPSTSFLTSSSSSYTPKSLQVCNDKFIVPVELEDISDENLRQEIACYMPGEVDLKEQMTKVQLAFFLMWVEKNDVKGRKDEAKRLESEGIRRKIWVAKNDGKRFFVDYLHEKIRNYVRKQRRSEKKRQMNDDFEMAEATMMNLN